MPIGLRALAIELGIPIHHEDKVGFLLLHAIWWGIMRGVMRRSLWGFLGMRGDAETRRGFVPGVVISFWSHLGEVVLV